jgi:hypothetical protein
LSLCLKGLHLEGFLDKIIWRTHMSEPVFDLLPGIPAGNDDSDVGPDPPDLLHGLQSIHAGHGEIQQQTVNAIRSPV